MDFHQFFYKLSIDSNREMECLNEVLKTHKGLANIESYKMMQVETAKKIKRGVKKLINKSFFFRPEFRSVKR